MLNPSGALALRRYGRGQCDTQPGNGQGWRQRSSALPARLPALVAADTATRYFTSPKQHRLHLSSTEHF